MMTKQFKPYRFSFTILFTLGSVYIFSQNLHASKVQWMTFEQAEQMAKSTKSPKKIMVDLYTDNCGWCKKMDLSTFQNEFISHFMNENFYPIKFNAQQKKDVIFNDNTFRLDKSGFHELAIALSMGDLGFPTLVFLDQENQIIQPIQGYQSVDELERIMYYFANDLYRMDSPGGISWNEFVLRYKPTNSKPNTGFDHPNIEAIKKKN